MHLLGKNDAARLGKALQPRRHIDAVAVNIVAFDDDIAEVEAESSLPFAVFDIEKAEAELEEDGDEFEVEGRFVAASAIDVLNEDVTVTFGDFCETIPAGSFFRDDDKEGFQFEVQGDVSGIKKIEIRDDGEFEVKGRGMDLSGIDFASPVPFSLQIGDDRGISAIPFKMEDKGKFEFEADADDDDD